MAFPAEAATVRQKVANGLLWDATRMMCSLCKLEPVSYPLYGSLKLRVRTTNS